MEDTVRRENSLLWLQHLGWTCSASLSAPHVVSMNIGTPFEQRQYEFKGSPNLPLMSLQTEPCIHLPQRLFAS